MTQVQVAVTFVARLPSDFTGYGATYCEAWLSDTPEDGHESAGFWLTRVATLRGDPLMFSMVLTPVQEVTP